MKKLIMESLAKYTWGEKCQSFVLLESEGLGVKLEKMPPGTSENLHVHHQAQQIFYILKGTAVFSNMSEEIRVHPNEVLHIQPGEQHLIKNEHNGTLEFLVISQPATTHDRTNIQSINK